MYSFSVFLIIRFFQVAGKREASQEAEAQQWIETIVGERFPPGKTSYFCYLFFNLIKITNYT